MTELFPTCYCPSARPDQQEYKQEAGVESDTCLQGDYEVVDDSDDTIDKLDDDTDITDD